MSRFARYRRRLPELAVLLAALSLFTSAWLAKAQHDQSHREKVRSAQADRKIVQSGRAAIQSGCGFDNQRAHAIRKIIRRGKAATRGYYKQGLLNREQYLASLKDSDRAIGEIVVRDCARAARVLGR